MSGLTRDRGCLYYIPWIALAGSGLLIGGVGVCGAGSSVWMVLNAIFATGWWLIVAWLVVALMGCTAWAGLLYTIRGAIDYLNSNQCRQAGGDWLSTGRSVQLLAAWCIWTTKREKEYIRRLTHKQFIGF
ncbi:hypothetical protein V8C86DRAFT_2630173 [Haematococcus lacustris]